MLLTRVGLPVGSAAGASSLASSAAKTCCSTAAASSRRDRLRGRATPRLAAFLNGWDAAGGGAPA